MAKWRRDAFRRKPFSLSVLQGLPSIGGDSMSHGRHMKGGCVPIRFLAVLGIWGMNSGRGWLAADMPKLAKAAANRVVWTWPDEPRCSWRWRRRTRRSGILRLWPPGCLAPAAGSAATCQRSMNCLACTPEYPGRACHEILKSAQASPVIK